MPHTGSMDCDCTMALQFLPDNRILAVSHGDNPLCLWQWRTEPMPRTVQHDVAEPMPRIVQHDVSGVRPYFVFRRILASSPDGQLIAALFRNCTVIVADCTGNSHHTILVGDGISCMAISPDKERLATLDNQEIHLFDLKARELQRSLKTGGYYEKIAFSPDGQLLASINRHKITLWDLYSQRRPQVLCIGDSVRMTGQLVFSADGSRLRTKCGMLPLPSVSDWLSQPPSTIPADIVVIEKWVIWKMARVLWIPHHLTKNTVVTGNVVVFVTKSGLPIWIEFDLSKRPTGEALVNRFAWEDATGFGFDEASVNRFTSEDATDSESMRHQ
jgi:WD40 repeat protein